MFDMRHVLIFYLILTAVFKKNFLLRVSVLSCISVLYYRPA